MSLCPPARPLPLWQIQGPPLSCGWGSVLPPRDAGRVGLSTAGCGGCKGGGKALRAQTFGQGRASAGYSRVDGDDLLATPTDQQHPVQMLRQHLQELHVWGEGQGLSVQQRAPLPLPHSHPELPPQDSPEKPSRSCRRVTLRKAEGRWTPSPTRSSSGTPAGFGGAAEETKGGAPRERPVAPGQAGRKASGTGCHTFSSKLSCLQRLRTTMMAPSLSRGEGWAG